MTGPVLVTEPTMIINKTRQRTTRGQTRGLSGQWQEPVASLEIKVVGHLHAFRDYDKVGGGGVVSALCRIVSSSSDTCSHVESCCSGCLTIALGSLLELVVGCDGSS